MSNRMRAILVLLLLSGAVESFLYFPNIQDLKDFTNIDFRKKPKEVKASPPDLDDLDVVALIYWKMITVMKQDMARQSKEVRNSKIKSTKPKVSCQDIGHILCRI